MTGQSVKSRVLKALEEQRGIYLSGEELAEQLSCSRTAVWKAVTKLREEGYRISSGTNRGYALMRDNDILSPEAVQQKLNNSEIPVFTYKELASTNETLKEKLLEGTEKFPSGTVVIAEEQTSGKGRNGRSFASPKANGLYMSILLKPERTFIPQSLGIRAAAAVSVYQAVKEILGIELEIQWVNDLYYKEKKVCGVLTEAMINLETGDLEQAIVGIGIRLFDMGNGGIFQEGEVSVDRNALAARILDRFLIESYQDTISDIYRKKNRAIGQKRILFHGGRRELIYGKEILSDGQLKAVTEDGEEKIYLFGELQI